MISIFDKRMLSGELVGIFTSFKCLQRPEKLHTALKNSKQHTLHITTRAQAAHAFSNADFPHANEANY